MSSREPVSDLSLSVRLIVASFICLLVVFLYHAQHDFYMDHGNEYLNTSDNHYYLDRIDNQIYRPLSLGDVNNLPIIYLYNILKFGLSVSADHLAPLVNIVCILISYLLLEKAHVASTGRLIPLRFALGLLPVVSYIPLINKDSITVLFYCSLFYVLLFRTFKFLPIIFVSALVRVQNPIVAILSGTQSMLGSCSQLRAAFILLAYVAAALTSTYVQNRGELLYIDTISGSAFGLSQLRHDLDRQFYVGSFLTNFLLPLKYLYDSARSVSFDGSPLSAIIALGRIWVVLLSARHPLTLLKLFYAPWTFASRPMIVVSSVVSSFLLVWMISPVVHYRYFISIFPVIVVGLSIADHFSANKAAHRAQ